MIEPQMTNRIVEIRACTAWMKTFAAHNSAKHAWYRVHFKIDVTFKKIDQAFVFFLLGAGLPTIASKNLTAQPEDITLIS